LETFIKQNLSGQDDSWKDVLLYIPEKDIVPLFSCLHAIEEQFDRGDVSWEKQLRKLPVDRTSAERFFEMITDLVVKKSATLPQKESLLKKPRAFLYADITAFLAQSINVSVEKGKIEKQKK